MMSYPSLLAYLGFVVFLSVAAALSFYVLIRRFKAKKRQLDNQYHALFRQYTSSLHDTRALFDQIPEVVLVFERQWPKLLYANRQALDLFRVTTKKK